ncbi:HET domain-containing protein [Rutstroemia sp. NJR-2017a BVV2]|nr:HET domain-containing protein [Rutstroemia sp. NJR-2017a BVV2]
MRLLKCMISEDDTVEIALKHFLDSEIPTYAILSHRWGRDHHEVTFQDIINNVAGYREKPGYSKIISCCRQALRDGCSYVWIDTCCIDKTSSAELSEGINSMYSWYERSIVCYAYLNDVSSDEDPEDRNSSFRRSEWFTRGWTLQELIAPTSVVFFAKNWIDIGSKRSLANAVSDITNVELSVLLRMVDRDISVAKRMSWAANRKTSRIEDRAYSLIGLFGVSLPIIYGEGERSFMRLQMEIVKTSNDQSIFAWEDSGRCSQDAFASSVDQFSGSSDYSSTPLASYLEQSEDGTSNLRMDYSLTNFGLCVRLPLYQSGYGAMLMACLSCVNSKGDSCYIYLRPSPDRLPNHYTKATLAGKSIAHRVTKAHALRSFEEIFIAQRDPSRLVMASPIRMTMTKHRYILRTSGFEDLRCIECAPTWAWRKDLFIKDLVFDIAFDACDFTTSYVAILFIDTKSKEKIAVVLGVHNNCVWSDLVVMNKARSSEAVHEDYLHWPSPKYSMRAKALDWIKKPRTIPGKYVVLTVRKKMGSPYEQLSGVDISAR